MNRYENFDPNRDGDGKSKDENLKVPPIPTEEILADNLIFRGRHGQEYRLRIFTNGLFRVYYPETSFFLKEDAFDEHDLIDKRGAEPGFIKWIKAKLQRYKLNEHPLGGI